MNEYDCYRGENAYERYFIATAIDHADDLEMTEASFAATLSLQRPVRPVAKVRMYMYQ